MGRKIPVLQIAESMDAGVLTALEQLVNGLDPEQFDVSIAYSRRPGTPLDLERRFPPGVRLFHVPMQREIAPRADGAAFLELRRLIDELRPTVVHAHSSKAGVLGRAAARLCGVERVLYSPHGFAFLRQDISPTRRRIYRTIEQVAARLGGTVVACSEGEYEVARTVTPRAVLVRNAIDLDYIRRVTGEPRERRGERETVVAICGRVAPQRLPELFGGIAATACARRPGRLKFVWIGSGDVPPALAAAPVEITGWLPREVGLRRLADEVDIYLHTSRWEGLPMAILEAMALGKPVVATDVIGNRETVVHGETGFLATGEEALIADVLRLADDAALRRAFGRAGRRRVEAEFSLPAQIDRFERLYRGEPLPLPSRGRDEADEWRREPALAARLAG